MIQIISQVKSIIVINLVVLTFMLVTSAKLSWSADDAVNKDRRERCVKILYEGLNQEDSFWVSVHAAENLLWNGYFDGVKETFMARESTAGPEHRIGIWRVLARANKNNTTLYHSYVSLVREAFMDQNSPDRLHAIESLGKLGFSERLPEIIHTAYEGKGVMKTYARWVLANSGNPEDEATLAEFLKSDDSRLYRTASYGLRFFKNVRPETLKLLEDCATRLSHDAENRVYVVSALYVHSPPIKEEKAKKELLSFAHGKKNERYEVCEGLSVKGDESDSAFLENMLDDPDIDVRLSAANALIRIERRQNRGLKWLDWVVIGGYALFMLSIGWFFLLKQKSTEDYLLGGRKVNPVFSGISLFATLLSTISYLAVPGETIKYGPVYVLLYIASIPVIYFVIGYGFIPFFMRLKITSAYEILEKPLGIGVRLFGSIIFILIRITWMALLIFLAAKTIVVMMDLDAGFIPLITAAAGLITLIYSSMGGLRAVVTTDVTQFSLLSLGAVLTIIFVTVKMGSPMEWFPTTWAPTWDRFIIFSADPHVRLTVLSTMISITVWWICTAGSDQMAIQRYIATRNAKSARHAFLINNFADISISVLLMLVGFALLSFFRMNPHLVGDGKSIIEDADFLFPHYIANLLPVGITGLVLAGLLSAAMSSLSSGINSTTTVVISDFIDRFNKNKSTGKNNLRTARYISVIIGLIVIVLSFLMEKVPGNIIEVSIKTNGLFVAPLFNLFFMALFIPFATPLGTIFGSVYGFYLGVLFAFWDVITGRPGLSFQWILPISLLGCLVFSIIFSLLLSGIKKLGVKIACSVILNIPLVVIYFILSS